VSTVKYKYFHDGRSKDYDPIGANVLVAVLPVNLKLPMEDKVPKTSKPLFFSLRNLSIRKQLPLLICLLLVVVITLFGAISFLSVRRASLAIGEQRLRTVTEQLSSMFQKNMHTLGTATQAIANQPDVTGYLEKGAGHAPSSGKAMVVLEKILADSQTVWVELRDLQGKEMLHAGRRKGGPFTRLDPAGEAGTGATAPDAVKDITEGRSDSAFAGRFYLAHDSLYFPIIAKVTGDGKALGYLIRWRPVRATPEAIAQLSRLLGAKAAFYFGNGDGSLWTNLLRPLHAPPMVTESLHRLVSYSRPDDGDRVIAYAMPIPGTKWNILVQLSQELILEAANRFLYWIVGIGAVLVITGSLIAWLISRSFTRPLGQLQRATAAIAGGDYSSTVDLRRRDELGQLAASFNSMAAQVYQAREELEHKVILRTQELELVNKELEAFSYSVSHDLRAPLRAVSGYTMMLTEDYENILDDEAKRITGNILSNVKMMGRLIDDLIAFSRMGKREVRRRVIDMKELAEVCVAQLTPVWPEGKFLITIGAMPSCKGDEDLLRQVWMNLIGNALKYSSKGVDPRITIGSMEEEKGPIYYIRDNGAGFDMKYADKLFKVFQRLHSQEDFEGTGVGLALVKRILDKHKGEIWVESSPGKGAAFYFRLPD
jgi:signal transduction histidine kinase